MAGRVAALRRGLGVVAMATAMMLGCGAPAKKQAPPAKKASSKASKRESKAPSARPVLSRYLNLSFGRAHARAWGMLTARDRSRWDRDQYVRQEKANDQVRDQVGALGRARYSIASLKQGGSRATAVVRVSSGLGTSKLRFVLRLEGGKWRVDYGASWSELD